MTDGAVIRAAIEAKGMSLAEAARKAGISRRNLSRAACNKKPLSDHQSAGLRAAGILS